MFANNQSKDSIQMEKRLFLDNKQPRVFVLNWKFSIAAASVAYWMSHLFSWTTLKKTPSHHIIFSCTCPSQFPVSSRVEQVLVRFTNCPRKLRKIRSFFNYFHFPPAPTRTRLAPGMTARGWQQLVMIGWLVGWLVENRKKQVGAVCARLVACALASRFCVGGQVCLFPPPPSSVIITGSRWSFSEPLRMHLVEQLNHKMWQPILKLLAPSVHKSPPAEILRLNSGLAAHDQLQVCAHIFRGAQTPPNMRSFSFCL